MTGNHIIFHNPQCSLSRDTLAIIRHASIEPDVIVSWKSLRDYIGAPQFAARLEISVSGLHRHPFLANWPVVFSPTESKLCRPSDIVLDILPNVPLSDFNKECGVPFLRDGLIAGRTREFIAALQASRLVTDDVEEAGRTFFQYQTLGRTTVGFGGYELYEQDVLVRSLLIDSKRRARGIGGSALALLLRRAWDDGARRAWLFSETAANFFETKAGFKPIARSVAPDVIRDSRQATSLCPASATLMTRVIDMGINDWDAIGGSPFSFCT